MQTKVKYLKTTNGDLEFLGSRLRHPSSNLRDDHIWRRTKIKRSQNADIGSLEVSSLREKSFAQGSPYSE